MKFLLFEQRPARVISATAVFSFEDDTPDAIIYEKFIEWAEANVIRNSRVGYRMATKQEIEKHGIYLDKDDVVIDGHLIEAKKKYRVKRRYS